MPIDANVRETVRPSRRSVVRGAAWSVPVISVAATAPAFAASPCSTLLNAATAWETDRYTYQWVNRNGRWRYELVDRGYGYWRTDSSTAAYLTQDPDGTGPLQPLRVDISVSYGSNVRAEADQLFVSSQNVGGTSSRGLTLHQSPRDTAQQSDSLVDRNKSVVTFTFDRQVSSLTFTMTDIDSATADFRDAIGISGATITSYSIQNPAQVQGAGTVANPFRVVPTNSAVDNFSQNGGNVTVTLSNVTSFQIHYWNFEPAGNGDDQKVYLTNFQASYLPC